MLERVARGGGATNWFYCRNAEQLQIIADRLLPGSVVSFYFDGRVERFSDHGSVKRRAEELIASTGESVMAALTEDDSTLVVDFVNGPVGLAEFLQDNSSSSLFFAGVVPGRDNDGYDAVTITIPDEDGVVRMHPH